MKGTFKRNNTFEKRCQLAQRIINRYHDRVPIIVETNDNTLRLSKNRYLSPNDITVGAFLNELRKHAYINEGEAVFLFCGTNKSLVPVNNTIEQVYNTYKDDDGLLYMIIAKENTFGIFNISNEWLTGVLNTCSRVYRTLGR